MGELRNYQRSMGLCSLRDLFIFVDATVMVVDNDRVAIRLDGIVADHGIAAHDDTDLAFSPPTI
jgi:hypothetical protein